jgi:anti-sigma factor RsiW/antitoxin (DNA-binding transcriptional repressor) of toxin-antitoxin stability system
MRPTASQHPLASDIAAFAVGKLSPAAAEWVAQHLEECSACRAAADNAPTDDVVTRLSGSSDTPSAQGSATHSEEPPSSAPDDIPPALRDHSRYRVVRQLGRGGMGVVYQAEHRVMERLVAVKVISRALVDRPDALERFRREVRAAAKLDHPNIVKAYDAEQAGDLQLLAMEYVEGCSLADLLAREGPLPITHACHYVRQAALGLQHAFEQGMVHRDLKPHNLMLTPNGMVKVLDFGLAKLASEQSRIGGELTQENAVMGTPEYMAPEQAINTKAADIRADIYALGCTLYCLLAGRPPFGGDNPLSIILAHAQEPPPPVESLRRELPAPLVALVKRMLAKSPNDRPQTPKEVADALAPFARAAIGPADAETLAMSALPPPPAPPRRRWVIPATAAAGLALLGFGLWAGSVFKPKSTDGLVVVEVNEPNAAVFVDGEPTAVTWASGGKATVIRVKSGTHKVVVKKAGFVMAGEEVTVEERGRAVFTAKLTPVAKKPGMEDLEQVATHLRRLNFGPMHSRTTMRQHALDEVTGAVKSMETGATLTDPEIGQRLDQAQKAVAELKTEPTTDATNKTALAEADRYLEAALAAATIPKGEARIAVPGTGRWTIDGLELVQGEEKGPANLRFGNPEWTDYDFSCEVCLTRGSDHASAVVRATPNAGAYSFQLGAGPRGLDSIVHGWPDKTVAVLKSQESEQGSLQSGRWRKVRVSVRGTNCECYLDDALWIECEKLMVPNGRVGLRTMNAVCRFRNCRVTDPAGAVLWAGLPTLVAANDSK